MKAFTEHSPPCRYCQQPMWSQSRNPETYYCPGCREWLVIEAKGESPK